MRRMETNLIHMSKDEGEKIKLTGGFLKPKIGRHRVMHKRGYRREGVLYSRAMTILVLFFFCARV